jgi:hypothetical protein
MEEEWRDIEGFEGYYQVSNLGRVRSLDRVKCDGIRMKGRIMKTHFDACGYEMVQLRRDGKYKHPSIHRLVAIAFIPNPDNLPQVNHIDEIRNHNTVDNLEWCTVLYNQNYGHRRERASESSVGEKNANHRLTEKQVLEIREKYIPGHAEFGVRPLAEKYGVKYVTISKILQRKIWTNI